MKKFLALFVFLASAVTLAGCGATVAQNAVALDVSYKWNKSDQCSQVSPEISVAGIPAETSQLKVSLKDLDVPNWDHGGGKVDYTGQTIIPAGALKSGYNGPCPPSGSHTYAFKVNAVDAEGTIIGQGKAKQDCCL